MQRAMIYTAENIADTAVDIDINFTHRAVVVGQTDFDISPLGEKQLDAFVLRHFLPGGLPFLDQGLELSH